MKLWGGRFEKEPSKAAEKFTSSIFFDYRLAEYDVLGSIAHVKMLGKQKIIPKADASKIIKALWKVLASVKSGKFVSDVSCEDIHTDIEKRVIKLAGEAGKKMHTARSRNDQIALDERMYLRAEINSITAEIEELISVFAKIAKENKGLALPGFTHMQHAQPVSLSAWTGAYIAMLSRDAERFKDCFKRVNIMPLGACALAGTSLPIDRVFVAKQLGFPSVVKNTIDAVSDRDHVVEFIAASAIVFMHLSRLAEEMVIWSTKEFKYVEIPDEYSTGSSIMPQKKNPDIFELLRGKTGRVYGNLAGILTILKGLPLAYNSDMQEDKIHLFSAADSVKEALDITALVMAGVKFNKENITYAMQNDFSDAVEAANYLVKKGLSFKAAHNVIGKIVLHCVKEEIGFKELSLTELKVFSDKIGQDFYAVLNK